MYTLAASAVGMGVLALARPAEAKIVYTPANKSICPHLALDLNHDKVRDFSFWCVEGGHSGGVGVSPPWKGNKSDAIWGTLSKERCTTNVKTCPSTNVASALSAGVTVGSNPEKFSPRHETMFGTSCLSGDYCRSWGQWNSNEENKYLGLQFHIKGKVHYGWARISNLTQLTGYAYETIPNKPIITGHTKGPDVIALHPGSLGALAAGASNRNSRK
jgi:hypothetical protein